MKKIYSGKDVILYEPSNWYARKEVSIEGDEPVWVEVSKPYFENVLGISWMNRAARDEALSEVIARIAHQLESCAGVDFDGRRVYRLD